MPEYDATPFLDRGSPGGWGAVWSSVTLTLKNGEVRSICGADLGGDWNTGTIILIRSCLDDIVEYLGLPPLVSDEYASMIIEAVNTQLKEHPWAELDCPLGRARLDVRPYTCYALRQKSPSDCATCVSRVADAHD